MSNERETITQSTRPFRSGALPLTLAAATWSLVAACNPPVTPSASGGSSGRGSAAGGQGGGSSRPGSAGPPMSWPDGGMNPVPPPNQPPSVPGSENPACAANTVKAEQVPVDLLLLLDTSGSMNSPAGNLSKWQAAQQALVAFVKDARSAGLGVGLQFFPQPPTPKVCQVDTDCPPSPRIPPVPPVPGTAPPPAPPGGAAPGRCLDAEFCAGGIIPPLSMVVCQPPAAPRRCLVPGSTCVPHGVCAVSNRLCAMPNAPCPGGVAGDTCRPVTKLCAGLGEDSCELADYDSAAVGIATLPGNEGALVASINGRTTNGGTPTSAAIRGALAHLQKHQLANPSHRVFLVLATDGLPTVCAPVAAPDIAAIIGAARMGNPPISSYVIGVFAANEVAMARPTLEAFAAAGGTGMPFVLDATGDLGQRLLEALAQIRGSALPCEFTIPRPASGALDYAKVNVRFKGGSAAETTIPYVQRADRCDPMRGGWYYDVDPAAGAAPTRIMVCDATCKLLKSDPKASVSLAFGCKTEIIE